MGKRDFHSFERKVFLYEAAKNLIIFDKQYACHRERATSFDLVMPLEMRVMKLRWLKAP